MQKSRILIGITITLLTVVVGMFYWTGGKQLITLYTKYLSQDLPDKQYSYQDFTDRGPREMLHGYYAGSVGNTIYIWTYSGLKRYRHQQWTSVYYYIDTCAAVVELERGKMDASEDGRYAQSTTLEPRMTFDVNEWLAQVHRGDYVWVLRVGEGGESTILDKVWGNSNQYYPVEKQLTLEQCNN